MPKATTVNIRNTPEPVVAAVADDLKPKIEKWNAHSIRQMLLRCAVWDRLVDAEKRISVSPGKKDLTSAEKREALLDDMYRKGRAGDLASQKSYIEMSQAHQVKSAFDVQIGIVDYTIADKSLSAIVMDADEKPVGDILRAVVERCRIDAFSLEVTEMMEKAFAAFIAEAEVKFKDAADVPRMSGVVEADAFSDTSPVDAAVIDARLEKMMAEV